MVPPASHPKAGMAPWKTPKTIAVRNVWAKETLLMEILPVSATAKQSADKARAINRTVRTSKSGTAKQVCHRIPEHGNVHSKRHNLDKSDPMKEKAIVTRQYEHYLNPIVSTFISSFVLPSVPSFVVVASWVS
jgi:hypothetical protein